MASDEPVPELTRERLTDLRNGLLHLHKTLLDSERASYEREMRRIESVNHLLNLVLHDPWFAWLHDMSQLIVLIDEAIDAKEPVGPLEADWLIRKSRALLVPAEEGQGFEKHYFHALQRDPDVVIAHGRMTKVFARIS
jgi:hypothetical protein